MIIWSLGNEGGKGRVFQALYDWVKAYDRGSRPVQVTVLRELLSTLGASHCSCTVEQL